MAELYRKSVLEKLSSPEQLDKMITIISPSFWIAAIGGGTIVVAALIWSIFGKLPVNINVNGIYMNRDGIHSVYSENAGVIEEVLVKEGQFIEKGDVIARIDSSNAKLSIEDLEKRRSLVETVTFESKNDTVTADNQSLVDIKIQASKYSSDSSANEQLLNAKKKELEEQKNKTKNAEKELNDMQSSYYESMGNSDITYEQVQYSIAQSELATAKQYLESAKQALQNLDAQYANAQYNLDTANASGDEALIMQAQAEYDGYISAREIYQNSVNEWENIVNNEQAEYDEQYNSYINAADNINNNNTVNAQLSNQYSIALNNYNSELSVQRSIEDSIIQLEAQISAEKSTSENQIASAKAQFESTKNALLSKIDSEIKKYLDQIENNEIKSTLSGKVSGLNIVVGSAVNQGSAICRLSQGDISDNVIVCYVPVTEGRKIYKGMNVIVYPTTVNKQEYGHMEAEVISVDTFVTSAQDIQNQLGEDSLVQTFQQNGAVISVVCELRQDSSTVSGYYWSSKKGKNVALDMGTIVTADVVIEEKAPISMLIPYLKEKFTIKSSDKNLTV